MTSERVDALSAPAEVFYRRLMSIVDDFGRFDARLIMLRVQCFPLRVNTVREADISRWIAECEKAGLIALYTVSARQYGELLDFRQQVRAKHSKHPSRPNDEHAHITCLADATQVIADAHLDGGENPDENPDEKDAPRKRGRSSVSPGPLPNDFGISDRVRQWAQAKGFGADLLTRAHEVFVGRHRANGKRYADWDQAFQNCVREDWYELRGGRRESEPERRWE